jgi:prepilin-type N-terminal cleavage/methylation domain-containing protein
VRTRTGGPRQTSGQGFTLVEVLLATVLLLLLLGAAVFSFSSLEQGVRLEEGASQFESLLRLARAHAASSGREVRVVFDESPNPDTSFVLDKVRAVWEPDPLGQPGVMEDLPQASGLLEGLNRLVQVANARPLDLGSPVAARDPGRAGGQDSGDEWPELPPPIRFYADGSSDSAEIVLVSRDELDRRRVWLRLMGVTGAIKRSMTTEQDTGGTNAEPAAASSSVQKAKPPLPPPTSPASPVSAPTTPPASR